jgi:hypothetical protein
MKKAILVLSLICSISLLNAQQTRIDSIKTALAQAKDDRTAFGCYVDLFYYYVYVYPDSAVQGAQNLLLLARKLNSDSALIAAFATYSELYHITGNFPLAIQYGYKTLKTAEKAKDFLSLVGPTITCRSFLQIKVIIKERCKWVSVESPYTMLTMVVMPLPNPI